MDASGILDFIAQYGPWMGLFVGLFIYTLKNNNKREQAMQDTLNKFAESVGDKLTSISTDMEAVKADIEDIKGKID
jgi:hypothetical protein